MIGGIVVVLVEPTGAGAVQSCKPCGSLIIDPAGGIVPVALLVMVLTVLSVGGVSAGEAMNCIFPSGAIVPSQDIELLVAVVVSLVVLAVVTKSLPKNEQLQTDDCATKDR